MTRSQFARLAIEAFLPMLRSAKVSRMELKVLFSEDPAFVIRRADKFLTKPAKVLNIALDCGFGDVSNFNRAFRGEFGLNPLRLRFQGT